MKILFTSVGRRVELIQLFKCAGKKLDIKLKIYGVDADWTAPALKFCDQSINVPKIADKQYIPTLLDICTKEQIDILIPTIDTDLLLLAQNKKEFELQGTKVLISSEDKIKLCRDKRLTSEYFLNLGLCTPKSIDKVEEYSEKYPAFIKPIDGSSSKDAYKVTNEYELRLYASNISNYIIQPFIEGKEFTVDVMCDFLGNPIFITPRIRCATRAGEVLKTEIYQDDIIIAEVERLIDNFKPIGPITIQLIRDNESGKNYYIEINPRFGGGAPLSMKAGANSAEALLCILQGDERKYERKVAEDGAIFSRFDQSMRIN